MRVPLWGPLGGPLCRWLCYHRWIAWGMCQEALDLERSNGKERTESKCRKDKDHDLRYRTGPPAEFRRVFMCWVHKKCSGLKRLKKDPDYRWTRCQGTTRPLDGRPQKEVQVWPDKLEVVASFCYLGDMLSAAGGCELSTTTHVKTAWKKFKDLLPVLSSGHLFQNTWPCVQLLCVECNAPCQRDLAIDKAKPPASAAKWQGNDQTMSGRKTLSPPGPMSYLCGLTLRIWTSFWKREDFDGMDMWNAPMVQSRQPLTYRLMESVGLGGPKWHGSSWQRGIADSGSSRLSTLMIDVPGDLVWDLPCVQQASYLEGGPLMWMLPLYLHVNQKSDYDMKVPCEAWWFHSHLKS